jgi:hypothetical protein
MMELACATRSVDVFVEAELDGWLEEDFVVVLLESFDLVGELEDDVLCFVILKEVVALVEAIGCGEGLVPSRLLER